MRQIAIIGLGPSDHLAPWEDPAWEKWGLPWHPLAFAHNRLFEMHAPDGVWDNKDYLDRLGALTMDGIRLYVQFGKPHIVGAEPYPLEQVQAYTGDYFGSSIAYVLALAIAENAERIGLWGVDLSESTYDHQRPNLEYLIGLGRGRGLEIEVFGDGQLLKLPAHMQPRYGWFEEAA